MPLDQIPEGYMANSDGALMDVSRFSAAPSSHLSGYPFESQALPDRVMRSMIPRRGFSSLVPNAFGEDYRTR